MEDFKYDTTFDWVDKCESPDVQEDGVELLRIMDLFDTFPNNLYHARHKRLELLKSYKEQVLNIDITSVTVAHVASGWLSRLDLLIWWGENYGRDEWYQKEIRNRIKGTKKYKEEAFKEIMNSCDYWYNMDVTKMLEPWRK